jgi:hypothetical protein
VPLETFLGDSVFGDRLDQMAEAYREARVRLAESRKYNRERLNKIANTNTSLTVGDSVTVKAEERTTNTSRWDPEYEVIRVWGTTHWIRHQVTGRERKLHREKLTLVDPGIEWDQIPPRPRRRTNTRQ